jgi:hypothetical protein
MFNVKINNMTRNKVDDVVTAVSWTASVVDGENTAYWSGSHLFKRNATSSPLIPFSDLTEAVVIAWLDLDSGLEARLQAEIDENTTSAMIDGFPWTT